MVTLSSCLIWQIISSAEQIWFMEYGVYAWITLGNIATDRLTEDADIGKKKNRLFRWSSFWSWRVYKQTKLSHLGHRKPARIHWKADAPKTSHCLVRTLVQEHNWVIFLRKWARRDRYGQWRSLSGHVERIFVHKHWRILTTFGFNRTALRATQPKLHSMFCDLFLKIALSAAELMSLGHLGVAMWHRWTIICGVPPKVSVTPTSQRQLTLKGQYSWSHTMPCWTNFCSQKLKRRILTIFGFNRTVLRATQPSMFCAFFLKIVLWCRLATSKLRFDTVELLFAVCRQR